MLDHLLLPFQDQIQFFFEATINEENFGTLPMESISVDLNVVASSNYTEILTAATDETFPPVGVLQTRIRASCMQNYFGKNCSTFCAPRDDDSLGHFSCDAEGRVTCLPGYCGPETSCVEECNECESEPCLNGGTCTVS